KRYSRNCQPPDPRGEGAGGEPLTEFKPVQHLSPMMSLDNTYSKEEVESFVARLQKILPGQTLEWILEPKVDGVAINLRYEKGVFTCGATRGDGTTGADITSTLKTIRSMPGKLRKTHIRGKLDIPELLEVRGEVYMTRAGFQKMNNDRKAAG